MRNTLALMLALSVALLGARSAMAMGSMPSQAPAHAAAVMTDMAATDDHCAGQPDNCCDFDVCAFFCATATLADPAGRCERAWQRLLTAPLRWTNTHFSDHNRSPPAPPPRPLSLV